jgi:PAS domain S-box-containing protein
MKLPTFRILFIEDNPADVRFIKEMLKEVRDNIFEIESVEYFSAGLKRLSEGGIDIVLLDLGLPDSQGFDTFHKLSTQFPELPVIVVTGLDDEATGIRAVKEGAQDYLIKWEMKEHLLTSDIRYAIERKHTEKMLRESEEKYRLLVETSDDFVFAIDLEGKFMYGNKKSIDRFGNLYGKSYTIPVSPKYHQLVKENFIRRLRGEKIEPYPIEVIDKKGNRLWVEISGSPLVKEGKIVGAVYFEKDITERKQAEEALRESEERYKKLVASVTDYIYTVEVENGRSVKTTHGPGCVGVTGYTTEEYEDKPNLWYKMIYEEDKKAVLEQVEKVLLGERVPPLEHRIIHRNGSIRWITNTPVARYSEKGQLVAYDGMIADVTERKRAEEALRQREERFRALVQNSSDMIIVIDAQGTARYLSPSVEKILGYKIEEWIGKDVFQFVHPEDLGEVMRAMAKGLTHPNAHYLTEFRYHHSDGIYRYLEAIGTNLLHDPSVGGIVVNVRDITERKRAEERLRTSQEYARNIIDSSMDMIIAVDNERRITEFNPAAEETFGYSKEEIFGKSVDLLYSDPGEGLEVHKMTLVNGRHIQEITNKRKNGELFSSFLSASVLLDARGEVVGVMGVSRDITERVRQEVERKRLEEQLLQAQKMEAIGRFAGGIAHDFNNMLTAIIGYSQLLLATSPKNDPAHADLEEIKKAADHAAALTRKLLAFSRKQTLQPQIVNLNTLVSDIEKMLHRIIGEDIELVTILEPRLSAIQVDPGQVEQVLMNLVVNARDAMSEGGTITLKTENVTIDEEYVKVEPEARAGKFACLSVQDTGTGMDEETLRHIFEPFFTTKEAGKGTGLGLSTVYGIVKQHNGWLNVYSEPGQGSVFKIYLPVFSIEEGEETKEEKVSLSAELKGKGERILLVEDEEGVRKFAERVLKKNGYTVFPAGSVNEALDIFKQEKGKFHLVFTDIVLKDKPGRELVEQLLLAKPELKVIFTSGYLDEKMQLSIIQGKEFKFIQKPYQITDLLRVLKETIREG